VIGLIAKLMEKEFINILEGSVMMGSGSMIFKMDRVIKFGPMAQS